MSVSVDELLLIVSLCVVIPIVARAVRPRRVVAAFLALALLAGPAFALGRAERRALIAVNEDRRERGLDVLRATRPLSRYAERHARRMARTGDIFHSDMSFPKPSGWRCAGENVGVGRTIRSVERRFMRSRDHRENILSRCFERIGLGIVRADGATWEVQVFVG